MEKNKINIKPIFIFSLPRSGSTLLQKIITSSNLVSSASEPWILLPLIYQQKKEGIISIYSHHKSNIALDEIKKKISNYDDLLADYILSIYSELSDDKSIYFLDKTPKYYLIIDDIVRIFPDAKFIFLFRNPLSQLTSKLIVKKNRFKTLSSGSIDILKGYDLLSMGYNKLVENSLKLTYKEIVNNQEEVINSLNDFLKINIKKNILNNLSDINISGPMGDKRSNLLTDNNIDNLSINKWKKYFNTPIRKHIAIKFLSNINDSYFNFSNLNRDELIKEIKKNKTDYFSNFTDFVDLIYLFFYLKLKPYLFFKKSFKWIKNIKID